MSAIVSETRGQHAVISRKVLYIEYYNQDNSQKCIKNDKNSGVCESEKGITVARRNVLLHLPHSKCTFMPLLRFCSSQYAHPNELRKFQGFNISTLQSGRKLRDMQVASIGRMYYRIKREIRVNLTSSKFHNAKRYLF